MKVISVNLDLALYKFLTKMQRKMKNSLVCKTSQTTDLPLHKKNLTQNGGNSMFKFVQSIWCKAPSAPLLLAMVGLRTSSKVRIADQGCFHCGDAWMPFNSSHTTSPLKAVGPRPSRCPLKVVSFKLSLLESKLSGEIIDFWQKWVLSPNLFQQ